MPQPSETRLFSGGIDTDSAPFAVQQGDLLNGVNVRFARQRGQDAGKVEWIPGNSEKTAVTALLPSVTGTTIFIGKCVDDATAKLYLFYYNTANENCIIEYDTVADTARRLLDDTMVTGGLGFPPSFIACTAGDGLLLWCDGLHDQRYAVTTATYSASTPITAAQLTLVQEPGFLPPIPSRLSIPGAPSTVQDKAIQFAWRIVNQIGISSVLSPYSRTSLPARASDIATVPSAGNAINISISSIIPISSDWRYVELVARFLESNVYYVIRRWDSRVPADVIDVNAQIAGTSSLTFSNWTGDTLETVDEATAAKEFDANPQKPKYHIRAANRNLLVNFTEGYDTPPPVSVTLSTSDFVPVSPSATAYQPYIIIIDEKGTNTWYFAIIVRISGVNYLLPKDCSVGKFNHASDILAGSGGPGSGGQSYAETIPDGLFNIPLNISQDSLILLKEQGDPDVSTLGSAGNGSMPLTTTTQKARYNIVLEANGLGSIVLQDTRRNLYLCEWDIRVPSPGVAPIPAMINVEVKPSEYGTSGESRGFLPSARYSIGLQYFDDSLRKSGVVQLVNQTFATYAVNAPQFTTKLGVTMPSGTQAAIPDWATKYSLTMSSAQGAQRFGFFFGGIVKATFKRADGTLIYRDPLLLAAPTAGLTIYGISIPIASTFKYDYAQGDLVAWSVGSSNGLAEVIGTNAGHIVIQYTSGIGMDALCDGWSQKITYYADLSTPDPNTLYAGLTDTATPVTPQEKTVFIVFSGISSQANQYEVPYAFGPIINSGGNRSFGNFYLNNTLTAQIPGDAHTVIRNGEAGGGTGLSMSPHEETPTLKWINDLGRPAPTDNVGQKTLVNTVRWSNARIPGASVNGYGTFDANDFETTDITAGAISQMILTTRGAQDGGQLLVLCQHGSFSALVGQRIVTGADGQQAFTSAEGVIDKFNPLRGQWGCQSPKAVIAHEGKVWWVDAYKRVIVEFNESGAGAISLYRTARLWDRLLWAVADPTQISMAVDPFTGTMMVSLPAVAVTPANLPGFVNIPDGSDAVDGSVCTFPYDWTANRWMPGYRSGAEMMWVGAKVYGWKNGKLWQEFTSAPGTYYGQPQNALVAVPFVENFPAIKSPSVLKLLGTTAPAITQILAGGGAATIMPYQPLEGVNTATVMRNRVSAGASTDAAYKANGVSGPKLKGEVIVAILQWSGGTRIDLSSAVLTYEVSSGH